MITSYYTTRASIDPETGDDITEDISNDIPDSDKPSPDEELLVRQSKYKPGNPQPPLSRLDIETLVSKLDLENQEKVLLEGIFQKWDQKKDK